MVGSKAITKNDEGYQRLLDAWLAEGEPENFMVGSRQFTAIKTSDDAVAFIPQGGFDDTYSSRSPIPGS